MAMIKRAKSGHIEETTEPKEVDVVNKVIIKDILEVPSASEYNIDIDLDEDEDGEIAVRV